MAQETVDIANAANIMGKKLSTISAYLKQGKMFYVLSCQPNLQLLGENMSKLIIQI